MYLKAPTIFINKFSKNFLQILSLSCKEKKKVLYPLGLAQYKSSHEKLRGRYLKNGVSKSIADVIQYANF